MNIENLPIEHHQTIYDAFKEGKYLIIKEISVKYNLSECGGCLGNDVIREWMIYYIEQKILKINE